MKRFIILESDRLRVSLLIGYAGLISLEVNHLVIHLLLRSKDWFWGKDTECFYTTFFGLGPLVLLAWHPDGFKRSLVCHPDNKSLD